MNQTPMLLSRIKASQTRAPRRRLASAPTLSFLYCFALLSCITLLSGCIKVGENNSSQEKSSTETALLDGLILARDGQPLTGTLTAHPGTEVEIALWGDPSYSPFLVPLDADSISLSNPLTLTQVSLEDGSYKTGYYTLSVPKSIANGSYQLSMGVAGLPVSLTIQVTPATLVGLVLTSDFGTEPTIATHEQLTIEARLLFTDNSLREIEEGALEPLLTDNQSITLEPLPDNQWRVTAGEPLVDPIELSTSLTIDGQTWSTTMALTISEQQVASCGPVTPQFTAEDQQQLSNAYLITDIMDQRWQYTQEQIQFTGDRMLGVLVTNYSNHDEPITLASTNVTLVDEQGEQTTLDYFNLWTVGDSTDPQANAEQLTIGPREQRLVFVNLFTYTLATLESCQVVLESGGTINGDITDL